MLVEAHISPSFNTFSSHSCHVCPCPRSPEMIGEGGDGFMSPSSPPTFQQGGNRCLCGIVVFDGNVNVMKKEHDGSLIHRFWSSAIIFFLPRHFHHLLPLKLTPTPPHIVFIEDVDFILHNPTCPMTP